MQNTIVNEDGFSFILYTISKGGSRPDWYRFTNEIKNYSYEELNFKTVSFLLLLRIESTQSWYGFSSGQNHHVFQNLKEHNFGLKFLRKFLHTDELNIRRYSDHILDSPVLSTNPVYKDSVNLLLERDVSKFFKSLSIEVPYTVINKKLGVEIKQPSKKYVCTFKDGFKLETKLGIENMKEMVKSVDQIMRDSENIGTEINQFLPIKKGNKNRNQIIEAINQSLFLKDNKVTFLGDPLLYGNEGTLRFYNKKSKRSFFVVDISNLEDFGQLFKQALLEKRLDITDSFIFDIEVEFLGENEEVQFRKKVFDIIVGEINLSTSEYYLIFEGEIYEYTDTYINTVNMLIEEGIKILPKPTYLNEWKTGNSEDEYNYSHISANQVNETWVFHKYLVDYLEPCDILHIEGDETYLIHVKNQFDGDMRVLHRQIIHTMTLLKLHKMSNEGTKISFLKEYWNRVTKKTKKTSPELLQQIERLKGRGFDYFEKLFDQNITFVCAFNTDVFLNNTEINKSRSINAKLSLIALAKEARLNDMKIEFVNINLINNN